MVAGDTVMDNNTGTVRVSVGEPVIPFRVELMLETPAATPVANPPAAIVATVGSDELHAAELVRLCVLPSLKEPVAVNCWVCPGVIEAVPGVTVIDTNTGAVTVRVADPETPFRVALMFENPAATVVANPPVWIVATEVTDEIHPAELVRLCVLPSLQVPAASHSWVLP